MVEIADDIADIVNKIEPELLKLDRNEVREKSAPGKWSKQEILGHLVDSAANNHQRFVRAAYQDAESFTQYVPDEWVRIQHYNQVDWEGLVTLWRAYNQHLCHVIKNLPAESFAALCNIGKDESVELGFVVKDYLRHMQHHIDQIVKVG